MDYLFVIIVCLAFLSTTISYEETFENSTNLCDRCKCITSSREFVLDCQNKGFRHMIANWPEHNATLIATFSNNNISHLEILPDSDYVRDVILSRCGIETLGNGAFKAVKNLKYLDLSYNLLTTEEIAPEKFKGPYNDTVYEPLLIEHLDLSYNRIHSLPHNIFEHLTTSLTELNLAGNKLKILDHQTQVALSGLTNLKGLNLANNDLTELVGDAVKNLQKLRTLNLAMNKLDFVPETLTLLSDSLQVLYLDNNLIYELTDESFLGVKGIRMLSLTNLARLQYVNANAFSPLENLKILFLSDNPSLTTIDRDAFRENQVLEELYLHNNSLKDLHYNLTNWPTLRVFSLNDNDLICDCDLYNISQHLRPQIKQNGDGPYCINPMTDASMMIYRLTEEACDYEAEYNNSSHVINKHFRVLKLAFLTISAVFIFTGLIAVTIAFLRYRRYKMNRNYPFTTQVTYNPLRSSIISN
ncbi:unnamed protein product [Ceutorhynchus assimilis]|uniref:Uncharacterized protein n=1 Tax=Ceutorhynchus assimilis TaxID=467358 RepID=A0A9N9MZA4_9CUCU|nr:unnamed protein product [Ceutorhynchus assimilis]